jgi:hypothetical protein
MLIQLPNGLIDGPDHFNYADVDELRGRQQNYLANQELVVGNIGHVPKILEDLVLSLQTKEGLTWKGDMKKAIWKLPTGDIETILIKIRENTYGDKFYHGASCEHCQHTMKDLLLKLTDLKIDPLPLEEMMKPKIVSLPKSKMEAEVKATYLRDLFDMIKITTNKQDQLITSLVPLSIKSLKYTKDGQSVVIDPVKSSDIEDLPVSDLTYLQSEIDKIRVEGTVDTNVEIECINCHKDFSSKLNVFDPSFFDPTKGSMSGSM